MENNPVVIKVKVKKSEVVRLRPDAQKAIRVLQKETGQSVSELVSSIILDVTKNRGVKLEYEVVEDDDYVQVL